MCAKTSDESRCEDQEALSDDQEKSEKCNGRVDRRDGFDGISSTTVD